MTDIKDVKSFLYAWLGKNKLPNPVYESKTETRMNKQRFKCELRVPGISYSALGNSTNKKDAATNAALDFCQYLVREGRMQQCDIPSLTSADLDGAAGWQQDGQNNSGFSFSDESSSFNTPNQSTLPSQNRFPWNNAYNRSETSHTEYVTQKAEEIAAGESVDLKSEIHGGWTMENSKKALNEFLQKMKMQSVVYHTKVRESNTVKTMETSAEIFVPQLKKNLSGKGTGSNKKVSESACAMNIVRQMFHLNIMQAYGGPAKKTRVSTLPEIDIDLPMELSERVKSYVTGCGLELKKFEANSATADEPISIVTDQKLLQFPDAEEKTTSNVSWAPPLQNWNPWRASNIDEPPLAFMTLDQISAKINEKESVKSGNMNYEHSQKSRHELPVWQFREQIVQTVANNRVTLIKGETGCGKSTQVAQFLLDDFIARGKGGEFNAVVSQPRRISAISLAERVSNERGEDLGETCGYNVRFDSVSPRPYGSIMFCTVGVLLRMMENGLRGISHVVIDEIHERDVDTDFVMIVLREMVSEYKNLRVVLMSATIDTHLFTNFFGANQLIGPTPVIKMHGRTFPVQSFFLEDILQNLRFMPKEMEKKKGKRGPVDDDEGDEEVDDKGKNMNIIDDPNAHPSLKAALSRLSEKEIPYDVIEAVLGDIANRGVDGAVLIFLPGWAEIMTLFNLLNESEEFGQSSKYEILPLHSQLTSQEQRRVFNHYEGKRKIIISTNIAETSITIDDVVYVIDSCKAKERMYTSNNNMVHFATVWASRTNIIQRRGRAGRVRAGYAFHLCSSKRFEALDEHGTAEMLRIPLHQIALTIKLLRLGSVGDFLGKALEPPPYDMVVESEAVLQSMGALDRNLELTHLGKMLARMPMEPVIARVLILGTALGMGSVMCDVSSAMSFPTPFVPREKHHSRLNGIQRKFAGNKFSDHCSLVAVTQAYRATMEQGNFAAEKEFCERYSLSHPILKMTAGARRQVMDVLRNQCGFPDDILYDTSVNTNGTDRELDLMRSLLVMALYPNVCYYTGKRKVITIEQSSALINKYSNLVPLKNTEIIFPSPLLVFTEKVRTRCISCKDVSVVTAIQLLVFGSRKVECIGTNLVRLDDMITIKMNVETAISLVALRPCIEAFLVRSCQNPESLGSSQPQDAELCQILRDISSEAFMTEAGPLRDSLLTDTAIMTSAPVNPPRGASEFNDWGFSSVGSMFASNNNSMKTPPYVSPQETDSEMEIGGGKMSSPRNMMRGGHPYQMPNNPPQQSNMGYANFLSADNQSAGDWHNNSYQNNRGGGYGGYGGGNRGGYDGGYGGGNRGGYGGGYGGPQQQRGGYRGGRGRGRGWSASNW